MKSMVGKIIGGWLICGLVAWIVSCSPINRVEPRKIEAHKECPLCGMIPARYPEFHCQVIFENGDYEAFDSAAELLVYLLFPERTEIQPPKVRAVFFRDHQSGAWIEAEATFFVVGSDVLGPMGIEFLAADSREKAEEIMKTENGQRIVSYREIDRSFMLEAARRDWLHMLARQLVLGE